MPGVENHLADIKWVNITTESNHTNNIWSSPVTLRNLRLEFSSFKRFNKETVKEMSLDFPPID